MHQEVFRLVLKDDQSVLDFQADYVHELRNNYRNNEIESCPVLQETFHRALND